MTGDDPARAQPGFAQLLRRLRIEAGLTQEELAAAAGLSPRALGNLERNKSAPHRSTAARLAEVLHLGEEDARLLRRQARLRAAAATPDAPSGAAPPADAGRPFDPVRAHAELDARSARLFAVIGLHPTRRLPTEALAYAAGMATDAARHMLEEIAGARLVVLSTEDELEISASVHTLAHDRVAEALSAGERAEALDRMLRWYLAGADAADRVIAPLRFRVGMSEAVVDVPRRSFSGRAEALAWCDRHQATFGALAELAVRAADPRLVWLLPWALGGYLDLRRPPELSLRMHQVGLTCARENGDVLGQAAMLGGLGLSHYYPRRFDDAAECFREARPLWQQLDEPVGEAGALNCLANVYLETRQFDRAHTRYRDALALYRKAGDRRGEAVVLTNLAETFCEAADFEQAAQHARTAALVGRDAAYPRIESMAACQLARALAAQDRNAEADALFAQAIALSRSNADHHALAWALTYRGYHLRTRKSPAQAAVAWQEAIAIFDELGDPHAARLRAELVTLSGV